jgi:plastocyanin
VQVLLISLLQKLVFLRLPIGDYAQFNSNDGEKHDIAQGQGDGFGASHEHDKSGQESGTFSADEGYKVQFKKVGIYEFHDHFHPATHVTVIAYDPNEKKTTPAAK